MLDAIGVQPHGDFFGHPDLDRMLAQNLFYFSHCGLYQIKHTTMLEVELEFVGLELCHFCSLTDQPVQAIRFFVDDRHQFLAIVGTQTSGGEQAGDRGFDRSQWSSKLVGDGVENRGTQPFAFARRFGTGESLHRIRALDRDGDQAPNGRQRLPGKISRHADRTDRPDAHLEWRVTEIAGAVHHGLAARDDGFELVHIQLGHFDS